MGGLGNVSYTPVQIGGEAWPGVTVWTDHPAVSCMASQYAGWAISVGKFFAMGSGPLRAHARVERELFEKLGYAEEADARRAGARGARRCPTDEVAAWVAAEGPAQAVAAHLRRRAHGEPRGRRADLRPHPRDRPPQDGDAGLRRAPGRERHGHRADSAGGQERPAGHRPHQRLHPVRRTGALHVRAGDAELAELAAKVPASASRDYGTPFYDIFQRYEGDFYKIDPLLFSPGEVWLTSTETGRTFHAGRLNPEVLTASCYPS